MNVVTRSDGKPGCALCGKAFAEDEQKFELDLGDLGRVGACRNCHKGHYQSASVIIHRGKGYTDVAELILALEDRTKNLEERVQLGIIGLELLERDCPCGGKSESPQANPHVTNCLVQVTLKKLRSNDPKFCKHDWKDIRNKIVKSGEMCFNCGSIRAGNAATGG